jgi:hypothetical protein
MNPKWIQELNDNWSIDSGLAWYNIEPILERINALLEQAAASTDNETLYEEIMKETKNV